ncbi:MAG: PilZ domain-containing protein [Candidatus Omnitrophica bacterium]|nr:PilZ domain-containing protein [Candidatus Omnitrophota bacterium]MDD5670815.1 PilZ domain-containing protein [Candidatus Omnitrophota bacterium]
MWDGFNQRKFPRLNLQCEVMIRPERDDRPLITKTENVGVGGVCIIQDQPLERFSRCRIRLELDQNTPSIECEGKVCWIIPKRTPLTQSKQFDTGIEFVGLSDQEKDRLKVFIQERLPKRNKDSV